MLVLLQQSVAGVALVQEAEQWDVSWLLTYSMDL